MSGLEEACCHSSHVVEASLNWQRNKSLKHWRQRWQTGYVEFCIPVLKSWYSRQHVLVSIISLRACPCWLIIGITGCLQCGGCSPVGMKKRFLTHFDTAETPKSLYMCLVYAWYANGCKSKGFGICCKCWICWTDNGLIMGAKAKSFMLFSSWSKIPREFTPHGLTRKNKQGLWCSATTNHFLTAEASRYRAFVMIQVCL